MKLVKFNVSTEFHNIPDNKYDAEVAIIDKLAEEGDMEAYAKKINPIREKWLHVRVKIGQEIAVPDWYYEAHKNDTCKIGRSFDHYRNEHGQRMPFDTKEAIRHRDMLPTDSCMKTVKRFELIKDLPSKK